MTRGAALAAVVGEARIIVCAGTGGVGKTTTAAALGIAAARAGRRAVVLTIDPARRLGDALGGAALDNEPRRVPGVGRRGGSLHATMLDSRATFDGLIGRDATDPAQRERILQSSFYRNIAGGLSGTQDYMAIQRLYELAQDDRFDVVIVDTPPARDALAVLDAPRRFAKLLDHWLYRLLLSPGRGLARSVALSAATRQIGALVDPTVIADAVAFFRSLEGIEEGFRLRSAELAQLLQSPQCVFVLVAVARPDTFGDLGALARSLAEGDMHVGALVINRVTPQFAPVAGRSAAARAVADFRALAAREETVIAELGASVPHATVVRVPLMDHDVVDLAALGAVADVLVARTRHR